MIQAPNYLNPYMQPVIQQQPAPNYNAVKIDVHNPTVSAPGVGQVAMSVPQMASQYAPVTAPYYNYPEAQLYNYPQVQNQPYYMPQALPMAQPAPQYCIPQPVAAQQPMVQPMMQPMPQALPMAQPMIQPYAQLPYCTPCPACNPAVKPEQALQAATPQIVQQQNYNAPAPVVTETASAPKVEVVPPKEMTPQIDLNSFIARLTSSDYEVQANAMEEIANMVKDEPQKATELLDEKIVNALNTIINADSTKLAGPTAEQVAAREKLKTGAAITDAEKELATKITPMEQVERNKSYAIFTSAIMQKLYGEEVAKLTGSTVPLTELPGAVTIVEQLKNNPNPMVRTSAIEALSYIQRPEYKQDLTTLFNIAKNDQDKYVQDAANAALAKIA